MNKDIQVLRRNPYISPNTEGMTVNQAAAAMIDAVYYFTVENVPHNFID